MNKRIGWVLGPNGSAIPVFPSDLDKLPEEIRKLDLNNQLEYLEKTYGRSRISNEIEIQNLKKRILQLENALKASPMPVRESTLKGEDWEEAYSDWWHEHASEKAILKGNL